MKYSPTILCAIAAFAAAGCLSVKTQHEIQPIHITMDVNLKVDSDLEKAFGTEETKKSARRAPNPAVKTMLEKGQAKVDSLGFLVGIGEVSEANAKIIKEENAESRLIFEEIAQKNNTTSRDVGKRRAEAIAKRHPEWME